MSSQIKMKNAYQFKSLKKTALLSGNGRETTYLDMLRNTLAKGPDHIIDSLADLEPYLSPSTVLPQTFISHLPHRP